MAESTQLHLPPASEALLRDLAMVLTPAALDEAAMSQWRTFEMRTMIGGEAVSLDDALAVAGAMIAASRAPAIVGMNQLTVEAAREAVALADAMHGRLLPWPSAPELPLVTQTASLGHALDADLHLLVPSPRPAASVFMQEVLGRAHARHSNVAVQALPAGLDDVMSLRLKFRAGRMPTIFAQATRIAIWLRHPADPLVAEQYHRLAAELQQQVRAAVITEPHPDAGNARGVHEVITWQTGVAPVGGVDFGDGAPRACPAGDALLPRGACDLLIDAGSHAPHLGAAPPPRRIVLAPRADRDADVCFVTPGLAPGLAARVMRFDGQILWLTDNPTPEGGSPPDPVADLLAQLRAAITADANQFNEVTP